MDQPALPLIEHPRRAKRAPKPPRPPKPPRDPHAPIPLRDPRGVTRAWACVHCRRVSMPSTCFGPDAWRREAERSREAAATCCVCRDCGAVIDRAVNRWQSACVACEAKRDAAIAAVAPRGEWVPCPDCVGGRVVVTLASGATSTAECPTCDGDTRAWRPAAPAPLP